MGCETYTYFDELYDFEYSKELTATTKGSFVFILKKRQYRLTTAGPSVTIAKLVRD